MAAMLFRPIHALPAAAALTLLVAPLAAHSQELVQYQITSDAGDREVRQSSAGAYTIGQEAATHLRVGFQSGFGSDGQPAGGINAIWFFKLPKLDLAGGDVIDSANFLTTLMEESAGSPITPRFNADLYALGFVSSPTIEANEFSFFAGQEQSGAPGFGEGQFIQKVDNDFFTIFSDWESVNAQSPRRPKPVSTDDFGRFVLRGYIEGIYMNPAFPNTGEEYLVLRLSPDRAAAETYFENGMQPYGKGATRYRLASFESSTLTSTAAIDYTDVVVTQLTLSVFQIPEPGAASMAGAGALLLAMSRRRR